MGVGGWGLGVRLCLSEGWAPGSGLAIHLCGGGELGGEGVWLCPLSHPHGEEGHQVPLTPGISAFRTLEKRSTPSLRVPS